MKIKIMNDKFVITLRKINRFYHEARRRFKEAPSILQEQASVVQDRLNEDLFKGSNILKSYARDLHNQIVAERSEIAKRFVELVFLRIKKFSKHKVDMGFIRRTYIECEIVTEAEFDETLSKFKVENIYSSIKNYTLNELDEDIQYFTEILNAIDSLLGDILEFFIAYYPEEYQSEQSIKHIKRLIPFDSEILKQFLARAENKNSGSNGNIKGKMPRVYSIHFETYEEMFFNIDCAVPAFEVLKKMKNPAVDNGNETVAKNTGYYAIWLKKLEQMGIIKLKLDRKDVARVMSNKIKGLSNSRLIYSKTTYSYPEHVIPLNAIRKIKDDIERTFEQLSTCADVQAKN